jgi:hypothetical protein
MGKEMVGEELHSEDIKSIRVFVIGEGCPPKKKKKSEERCQGGKKGLLAQAKKNFSSPKEER